MKILLVTDAYPPEIRSASHLIQELAEELRDRGHEVCVATCFPAYNLTEESQTRRFDPMAVEDGIAVLRVKSPPTTGLISLFEGSASFRCRASLSTL